MLSEIRPIDHKCQDLHLRDILFFGVLPRLRSQRNSKRILWFCLNLVATQHNNETNSMLVLVSFLILTCSQTGTWSGNSLSLYCNCCSLNSAEKRDWFPWMMDDLLWLYRSNTSWICIQEAIALPVNMTLLHCAWSTAWLSPAKFAASGTRRCVSLLAI